MPLCLRFNPDFCCWTFVLIALDIALIFNGNLKIKWCKIIYCKLFSSDFFVKGRLHIKKWVGMTLIKAMYVFFFFFTRPFGYVFSRSVGEVFLYLVHWFVTFSYNSLWVPGIETPRTHTRTRTYTGVLGKSWFWMLHADHCPGKSWTELSFQGNSTFYTWMYLNFLFCTSKNFNPFLQSLSFFWMCCSK